MGIDRDMFNFLLYAKKYGNFGKTVTIGRQGNSLPGFMLTGTKYENVKYCEPLMKDYFGSESVDSIDISNYENATILHDMNKPLPEGLKNQYDTVIDSGTLEHIYNIPQALENCSFLCKPGGQIIHSLPANNSCGHGFWQISPELFFSLYSEENGYKDTEVFLKEKSFTEKWFKVIQPRNGNRVNIFSKKPMEILCRTVLNDKTFNH
jgi:SAM-dependent methyltransferase